jgi:GT2 family glycosyltransferase
MKYIHNFPFSLSALLAFALEDLDKGDLLSAFQIADQACRLTDLPDINALLVRATILSRLGNFADAVNDLKTAHLMMPSNHTIAFSLLRLCQSDWDNHHAVFTQVLICLLRTSPALSFTPEVLSWLAVSGLPVMGAAWRQEEYVVGWMINKLEPEANLLVELDGGFFSVKATMPTPLLVEAGIGNGYNGFCLKLPDDYHLLRLGVGGSSLWGCPFIANQTLTQLSVAPVSDRVDIIVPVYAGRKDTLACLDAIKASKNQLLYRVVVVDDSCPDSILSNALKERAQRNEITLVCRPINAGFSGAVNTALVLDNSRDVVVLNADTLVFANWLDRLHATAYASDDIATVTPLSNHGELLSYPRPMNNNQVFDVKHAELIDQLFALTGMTDPVNIPVGVGFCFYIKRHAINKVGLFDEGTFGRGYGEDTDFCLRVQQAGLRNVSATNTYVVHWGSRSFGNEKQQLLAQNLHQIAVKYPKHAAEYDYFLAEKPLKFLYREVQRQLLTTIVAQYKAILNMASPVVEKGVSFTLRAGQKPSGQWQVTLIITGITGLDHLVYQWPEQAIELQEDILAARFRCLVFKSLGGWPEEIIGYLTTGFITYEFDFEDYSGYCPRKYRLTNKAVMCNDPVDNQVCSNCVAELGVLVYGYTDMVTWRDRTLSLLAKAKKITVLNKEISDAYSRRFPMLNKKFRVNKTAQIVQMPILTMPSNKPIRIAVLSAGSLEEGYLHLVEQASESSRQGWDIEFFVLGNTLNNSRLQQLANVYLVGSVKKEQFSQVLRLYNCNAIANFSPCVHIRYEVARRAEEFKLPLVFNCKVI